MNLLLGAALLAVAPAFSEGVAATAREEALESGGVGLLAVTIVGIPLSIAGTFVFALIPWIASVYGGFAVGRWLLSLATVENRWAALVVGLVAVALAGLVPILGGVVGFVVLVLGLGAFVLTVHGWYADWEARHAEQAS